MSSGKMFTVPMGRPKPSTDHLMKFKHHEKTTKLNDIAQNAEDFL